MSSTCLSCDTKQAFRVYSFQKDANNNYTNFVEVNPKTGNRTKTLVKDTEGTWGYRDISIATHPCTCELFGVGRNDSTWDLFVIDFDDLNTIKVRGSLEKTGQISEVSDISFRATDGSLFLIFAGPVGFGFDVFIGNFNTCTGKLSRVLITHTTDLNAGLSSTLDGLMLTNFKSGQTLRVFNPDTGQFLGEGISFKPSLPFNVQSLALEPCSGNLFALGPGPTFTVLELTSRTSKNSTSIRPLLKGLAVVPCAPRIRCPPNVTLPIGSPYGPEVAGRAVITNACPHRQTLTYSDTVVRRKCCGCACQPTVKRTWTATGPCDACTAQCVQRISFSRCLLSRKQRRLNARKRP